MHAILADKLNGRAERICDGGDFIEVPSQMLEEFFRDEKLLQAFAKHYQTGETLPSEIIRKMKLAGAFGRADWVRSQLYYTTLSLDLHDRNRRDWTWTALRSSSTRACNPGPGWKATVCTRALAT